MASVNLFVQTSMCVQSADKFQGSRQVRKEKFQRAQMFIDQTEVCLFCSLTMMPFDLLLFKQKKTC